jgi:hypothetical protein
MNEHSVSRTLVKSPPELWAELSDPAALARHLGEFGEIAITRLEPERAVAWEGERARGTVALEPAGWGTRVTFEVVAPEEVAVEEEPVKEEPAVEEPGEDVPPPRRSFFARLFGRRRPVEEEVPEAVVVEEDPPTGEPRSGEGDPIEAILTATLDTLGGANHRPFSRG